MKFLKIVFASFLCFFSSVVFSQELNCSVQVLTPQAPSSADKKILETLRQQIFEFMNNRKWTNDVFQLDERIECSLVFTISDHTTGSDQFKGTLQVQVRIPIYKSSYNSLLVNIVDKNLDFRYVEYQPMEYVENSFTSNLTSLLAYYAYV